MGLKNGKIMNKMATINILKVMSEKDMNERWSNNKRGSIKMNEQKIARKLVRLADKIMSLGNLEKDIEKISKLTDNNQHTDALIYLYNNILNNKKAVKALKAIDELHEYFGYLPKELSDLRYNRFYKEGMKEIKKKFSSDIYDRIYGAF